MSTPWNGFKEIVSKLRQNRNTFCQINVNTELVNQIDWMSQIPHRSDYLISLNERLMHV